MQPAWPWIFLPGTVTAMDNDLPEEVVALPIDGTLDLHAFSPRDLKYLIPDYIEECVARDIKEIRIVHGKGMGNMRRSVHALLDRNEHVTNYRLGNEKEGSWGATLVWLQR